MTAIQLVTKGIIPKHLKSHGVSIATKGYISVMGLSEIIIYEIMSLESYINTEIDLAGGGVIS